MINIVIMIYDDVLVSSFALPQDVFQSTGVLWNRISAIDEQQQFSVNIVSPGGTPVRCYNSVEIRPQLAMEDVEDADVILIAASMNLQGYRQKHRELISWLKKKYDQGSQIASICTGAFMLAETGLLNGKSATTHWGMVKRLQDAYPDVRVLGKRIVTDEGDLYCSGGANAGGDLALHLVGKFCGNEVAHQTSRVLLLDPTRQSQAPYVMYSFDKRHGDGKIIDMQEWIEMHYNSRITVDLLAKKAAMSRRNFERRFKIATGESPIQYLQRFRIEKAKLLLQKGESTFDEITAMVGYEDSSTFRKIFQKNTGLQPGAYKQKFLLRLRN